MKVLFDSNGLQAAVYLGKYPSPYAEPAKGKRLSTFLSIIEDFGCDIVFTEKSSGINSILLDDCSVLVITTRMSNLPKPSETELKAIRDFVLRGGSLLLMSNHPWPKSPNPIPDADTASLFDVSLYGPVYDKCKFLHKYIRISGKDIMAHSITKGLKGPILYRNGCRISTEVGEILARLPGEKRSPNAFAVALESPQTGKGRVVVTADSGFIGNDDTNFPGQGLINKGCNIQFVRQIFQWLLRQR